jgi:tight adherence protein C
VRPYLELRIAGISFAALDTSALLLATAGAVFSLMGLWRIAHREARERRLATLYAQAVAAGQARLAPDRSWYRQLGTSLGTTIAAKKLISIAEQRKLIAELAAAGLKGREILAALIASKLVAGLAFVGLAWLYLDKMHLFAGHMLVRVALMAASFILGWRLPDFVLLRLAARRKLRIEHGFPDALDLLVVCVEVGLSLDQAIEEVARQLKSSAREVAAEFAATAGEMRVSSDRAQALENLAHRTNVGSLRSLVSTLVQSVRFGTPLAESLRLIASEMRAERMARIEERAARLPVLLTIPLMLFILPALMFVVGTPLLLRILDTLRSVTWHGF